MAVGKAVVDILMNNTSGALVEERVWHGLSKQQEEYPNINVVDFGTTEDTKDGAKIDIVTVSVSAYGHMIADCDKIHAAVRDDLERYNENSGGASIRTIRFQAYGPQIYDPDKKIWSRTIDFEVQAHR